jgi:hypothetical protein
MKAIQTIYKNYRFRSRLEARWAYFFDLLKVKWEYEPQGFDIDGEWYLPDFKVTSPQGIVYWYEIKPSDAPESEKLKKFKQAYENKIQNDWAGTIQEIVSFETLCGDPYCVLFEQKTKQLCPRCGGLSAGKPWEFDLSEIAIYCTPCDFDTSTGRHPARRGLLGEYAFHKGDLVFTEDEWNEIFTFVELDAKQARQARFEHGETPEVKTFKVPEID